MALAGGGGAGNTAGSNPSGVGSNLNLIRVTWQDRTYGYAYSGAVSTTEVETVLLDFSTGNYMLKGEIQFLYAADVNEESTEDVFYKMEMNGQIVISYIDLIGGSTRSYSGPLPIIIPAFTHITATAEMTNAVTRNMAAVLTGRIYE
jgi:hypothetical protein